MSRRQLLKKPKNDTYRTLTFLSYTALAKGSVGLGSAQQLCRSQALITFSCLIVCIQLCCGFLFKICTTQVDFNRNTISRSNNGFDHIFAVLFPTTLTNSVAEIASNSVFFWAFKCSKCSARIIKLKTLCCPFTPFC